MDRILLITIIVVIIIIIFLINIFIINITLLSFFHLEITLLKQVEGNILSLVIKSPADFKFDPYLYEWRQWTRRKSPQFCPTLSLKHSDAILQLQIVAPF